MAHLPDILFERIVSLAKFLDGPNAETEDEIRYRLTVLPYDESIFSLPQGQGPQASIKFIHERSESTSGASLRQLPEPRGETRLQGQVRRGSA